MTEQQRSTDELGRLLDRMRCVAIGVPTWILVNGTWAALSGIAGKAPEGFAISAYLIICLSTGNLCPLIMNSYIFRDIKPCALSGVVAALDALGLAAGVAMALSWPSTVTIGGQQTSLALMLCFLVVGASSSASNVAKYMLMANLSGPHTSHLSTGMALGSMLAGLSGIARGFSESQGFSVTIYLLLLCLTFVPSIVYTLSLRRSLTIKGDATPLLATSENDHFVPKCNRYDEEAPISDVGQSPGLCCFNASDLSYLSNRSPVRRFLLAQAFAAALGFGLVPALLSTVCAKFSSPYTVLLLATGISTVLDPIGRHLTASMSLKTHNDVHAAAAVLVVLSVGMLILGSLPPNSLYNSALGGILPAAMYIAFMPLFGFLNTSIFLILKTEASADSAQRQSVESDLARLCGIMSQTGAMVGSVLSFVVIFLFL